MPDKTQVALITGAARRIGAEIALTLHTVGMKVILHYNRSCAEATELCNALNIKRPESAVICQADLTQTIPCQRLIADAVAQWGQLDILINNASCFYRTPLERATEEDWQYVMDSNLKAPYFLSQAAAPYLKRQQGCIINMTDIHGERPMEGYSIYCISKAGLLMQTKALAKELGPSVRVNAVSPGAISWPEGDSALDEIVKQHIINKITLQRSGMPQDIAKAVLFLATQADYMTGQVMIVDGGRTLSI